MYPSRTTNAQSQVRSCTAFVPCTRTLLVLPLYLDIFAKVGHVRWGYVPCASIHYLHSTQKKTGFESWAFCFAEVPLFLRYCFLRLGDKWLILRCMQRTLKTAPTKTIYDICPWWRECLKVEPMECVQCYACPGSESSLDVLPPAEIAALPLASHHCTAVCTGRCWAPLTGELHSHPY